jgi:hypothetical protein
LLVAQELRAEDGIIEGARQAVYQFNVIFPGHLAKLAIERQGDFGLQHLVPLRRRHSRGESHHAFSVSKRMLANNR